MCYSPNRPSYLSLAVECRWVLVFHLAFAGVFQPCIVCIVFNLKENNDDLKSGLSISNRGILSAVLNEMHVHRIDR